MSKVIRLSDYTENLINEYGKYIKQKLEKTNLEYDLLVTNEDDLISLAMVNILKLIDHGKEI